MKTLKTFLIYSQPSIYLLIASVSFILVPKNLVSINPDLSFPFVFFWTIFKPEILPFSVLLGIGILSDSIQGLPLGFHSVLFLLSSILLLPQREFLCHQSFTLIWAAFGISLISYKILEYLILKIIIALPLSFLGFMFSTLLTFLLYPLCARISYSNLKSAINLS